MPMIYKDKQQSRVEFLESLQLEYIVAELRFKIYPWEKDKNYWEKVMLGKKEKVLSTALIVQVPTIFDDEYLKELIYKKVINEVGYPNFIYRDKESKEELQVKDFTYYYWREAKFSIETEDDTLYGILKVLRKDSSEAELQVKGRSSLIVSELNKITRIL